MVFLALLIVIGSIGATAVYCRLSIRHQGAVVNAMSMFGAYAVLDIYVPAGLQLVGAGGTWPRFAPPPSTEGMIEAVLVYDAFLLLFFLGHRFAGRRTVANSGSHVAARSTVGLWVMFALAVLYLSSLDMQVTQAGGWSEFFESRLKARWSATLVAPDSAWEAFLVKAGPASLAGFVVLTTGFFAIRSQENVWLRSLILPFIAWLLLGTTFFRGSQVLLFLSLWLAEQKNARDDGQRTGELQESKGKVLLAMSVAAFVAYGALRTSLQSTVGDSEGDGSLFGQLTDLATGHGLVGLSSILGFYPHQHDYLGGKTIIDMILLPIPRAIYTSKPEWYGIDDITVAMGWPESTQSAVTIPGELFANFGYFGLVFSIFYGGIFGLLDRLRGGGRTGMLYCFALPSLVPVTQWMSTTGLINALIFLPLALVLLVCCFGDSASVQVNGSFSPLRSLGDRLNGRVLDARGTQAALRETATPET